MIEPPRPLAPANSNLAGTTARPDDPFPEVSATESVVSAAVMVAAAFRLRDESGLIEALRCLTAAVAGLEAAHAADEA